MSTPVVVVGAGVVGLTCAIRLRDAGFDAHVITREPVLGTTSVVAAALWYPYHALPQDRVTRWAAETYSWLAALADTGAGGVHLRLGVELLREPAPLPWWMAAVPDLTQVARPRPGYAAGWRFTAPVVDMSRHLPWLQAELARHGGTLTVSAVASLEEVDVPVVVNATGLGAAELTDDRSMVPVRGQVVRVAQVGLTSWLLDQSDPRRLVYVVPRTDDIVLGGSADAGRADLSVDAEEAVAIRDRCVALLPELADAPVLGHAVGLRPSRPAVRLEREGRVVHCYGHGGAGVTLAWGCAGEVVKLVRECRP